MHGAGAPQDGGALQGEAAPQGGEAVQGGLAVQGKAAVQGDVAEQGDGAALPAGHQLVTLAQVAFPPPPTRPGARVEHILVQEPGTLVATVAAQLLLPEVRPANVVHWVLLGAPVAR